MDYNMMQRAARNAAPKKKYLSLVPSYRFRIYLELEGVIEAGFTECSQLSMTREVEEYAEGGVNDYVHKLPGRTKYGTVTLKRGVAFSTVFWNWYQEGISNLQVTKKNMSIALLSPYKPSPTIYYHLQEAWLVSWQGPSLSTDSNQIAIEALELAFTSLRMEEQQTR